MEATTISTRQVARLKRLCPVVAFAVVGLGFILMRVVVDYKNNDFESPFFGDISSWPSFFHGFIPLDLVTGWLLAWLMLSALHRLTLVPKGAPNPEVAVEWARWTAWSFAFFGGACGALITIFDGWYSGLEMFVLMGSILTVAGGLIVATWVYLEQLAEPEGLKKGIEARLSNSASGRAVRQVRRHFGADELAEPTRPVEPSANEVEHTTLAG